MAEGPPAGVEALSSGAEADSVQFGDESAGKEHGMAQPLVVSSKHVLAEFEREKRRLVAVFQQKKAALDAKGVFSPEVNATRAQNMLLTALGGINMVALERTARDRLRAGQTATQDAKPQQATAATGAKGKRDHTKAEKLERRLNAMFEQSVKGEGAPTETESGSARLEGTMRGLTLRATDGRPPAMKPGPGGSYSPRSPQSPRSPLNAKASFLNAPSSEPTSPEGGKHSADHSAGAGAAGRPHQHPQVVARREAEARHKEELRQQLQATRQLALSRTRKLQAEEQAVRAQVGAVQAGGGPAAVLSVAEFMQKAWEHKEYPPEALVAEHARRKRRPLRAGPPGAGAGAGAGAGGRSGSLAPDGEPSPTARKEGPSAPALWPKHSVKSHIDTQFQTPSLVELAGHLKTVAAPPLLPPEGGAAPRPPAPAPTAPPPPSANPPPPAAIPTPAPAPAPAPAPSRLSRTLPEPASPHELKYPGDLRFVRRTARASTIAQRQYRRHVQEELGQHQGNIHSQFQVKPSKELDHLPAVDDLVLSSSESDSEGEDGQGLPAAPAPAPPPAVPLPEVAACMLEDIVTFLCQEADNKRQGKVKGQKDINVMRNVLVQTLKLLLPRITTLSPDPLPSPRSPSRRALRAATPLTADPQHSNPLAAMSRTLRSWAKGVEVLLMWDLDMHETLSLSNEAHLHRLALYYCKLKAQIRRRMSVLMTRWQDNRSVHLPSDSGQEPSVTDGSDVGGAVPPAVLQQRWATVGAYLSRVATDKSAPEAATVRQFLDRYALQAAPSAPKPTKPNGFSLVKRSLLGSQEVALPQPHQDSFAVAGRLFANIWSSAVPGSALQYAGSPGWHGRAEEQHRRLVMENQDVLAIITKYIRLTAEPVQGRFRTLVLDVKHGIQAGLLLVDDEVETAEPSAEVRERQRQLEELEDTLAHRLLEVERDRLLKKYAHQYREKEDQLGRFYDVLQSSHIWSSTLRQRDGSTTGDLKQDEGARVMERESLQAQRMKKYDQFRRVHEQRLEQLDALARQIIPVTVHPKMLPTEEPAQDARSPNSLTSPTMTVPQLRDRLQSLRSPRHTKVDLAGPAEDLAPVPAPQSPPTVADLSQLTLHELRVHRLQELDVLWSALKVDFQEKLALYGKYDSPTLPLPSLDLALARWRAASEAVLAREQALQELEMSDWQSASNEAEERKRTALFTRFCQAGLQCESSGRRLEVDTGDELKYKGRPYLAKMQEDYLRILAALERRRAALQPPPPPDVL